MDYFYKSLSYSSCYLDFNSLPLPQMEFAVFRINIINKNAVA